MEILQKTHLIERYREYFYIKQIFSKKFQDHLSKKELKKIKKEKKKAKKLEKDLEKFEHIESIVEGGKNHRLEGENAEYSVLA